MANWWTKKHATRYTKYAVNGTPYDSYEEAEAVAHALMALDVNAYVNFVGFNKNDGQWRCFIYRNGAIDIDNTETATVRIRNDH